MELIQLTRTLERAIQDEDMQQWQAVKDAANQLTGVTDWVFNNVNEAVEYSVGDPLHQYLPEGSNIYYETGADACNATVQKLREQPNTIDVWDIEYSAPYCRATYSYYNPNLGYTPTNGINTWISKHNRTTPLPILNITYQQVAQKIISNTSSPDEGISLMSEAFITEAQNRYVIKSWATLDLVTPVVRSLSDSDMQQWQAVKDALKYFEQATSSTAKTGYERYGSTTCFSDYQTACDSFRDQYFPSEDKWVCAYSSYEGKYVCYRPNTNQTSYSILSGCVPSLVYTYTFNENSVLFSSSEKNLPVNHADIAQKIISNASAEDQGVSLLAETYLQTVAESIFNTEESRRFVKESDLSTEYDNNIYEFGANNLAISNDVLQWDSYGFPYEYDLYQSDNPIDLDNLPLPTQSSIKAKNAVLGLPSNQTTHIAVGAKKNGQVHLSGMYQRDPLTWVVQNISLNQEQATYSAIGSNGIEQYSSYAEIDLAAAITASLSDSDMQTWQAVTDAINALISGNTGYEFDIVNKKVIAFLEFPSDQIGDYLYDATGRSLNELCALMNGKFDSYLAFSDMVYSHIDSGTYICKGYGYNWVTNQQYGYTERILFLSRPVTDKSNTFNNIVEKSFNEVAQKIISNASSANQAISLLAETYIQEVANSIFNTDESKQFVKLANTVPVFEMNIYNFGIENLTANFVLGEGLKIEWTTFGLPGNVSYYKSEVPLDLNNMPSLTFANISGSTYTDPNTSNKVCYIAVGVTKNGVSKFSNVVKYLDGELFAPTNVTFEVVKY